MTLKDVAEDAGVALNTARKALQGDSSVRHYIRDRVIRSAKKLSYTPNILARGLRVKSLNLVPISVIKMNEAYFGSLAINISDCLVSAGFEPLLCTQPSRLIEINKTLHSCACIFCYAVDETMVRSLANSQKVVTINAPEYSIHNAGNVICDFDSGYIDATNYVISTGRTRVAILSDYYTECVELGKPLLKFGKVPETLADSGLKLVSPRNVPSFRNEAELADFLSRSRKNKVDAVFCENDVIAAKLYSILASMGYRIPEDVLIIGCDANIPLEGCLSMKIDCADIAKKAVSVLRKLFEGEGKSIIELSIPYLVNSKGKRII